MLGFLKLYALFMAHTGIWYCLIWNAKDGNKKGSQLAFTTITASLCAIKEFAYCFVSPLSSRK